MSHFSPSTNSQKMSTWRFFSLEVPHNLTRHVPLSLATEIRLFLTPKMVISTEKRTRSHRFLSSAGIVVALNLLVLEALLLFISSTLLESVLLGPKHVALLEPPLLVTPKAEFAGGVLCDWSVMGSLWEMTSLNQSINQFYLLHPRVLGFWRLAYLASQ